MIEKISFTNGYASSGSFYITYKQAVKQCIKNSEGMCCTVWLHVFRNHQWIELGRTVKKAPLTWVFERNLY